MIYYMKAPFTTGAVTSGKYVNWIALDSIKFDVSKDISQESSGNVDSRSGHSVFSKITVTKKLEQSSGHLMNESASQGGVHDIILVVLTTGKEPREYLRITLADAVICKYDFDASNSEPSETIEIAYSEIECKFTPYEEDSKKSSPVVVRENVQDHG